MSGELGSVLRLFKWVAGLTVLLVVAFPAFAVFIQFGATALGEYSAGEAREARRSEVAAFEAKYAHIGNTAGPIPLRVLDTYDELKIRRAQVVILLPKGMFPGFPSPEATWAARLAAPSYADAECTVLLASLASRCRPGEVSISSAAGGLELKMSLLFTQREDLGTLPNADQLRLEPVIFDHVDDRIVADPKGGIADGIHVAAVADAADARDRIYRRAAQNCATVRRKFGNCWIYDLKISSRLMRAKAKEVVSITGRSSYAYLLPDAGS